jgi:CDP-glucose 4,6-dehydratase
MTASGFWRDRRVLVTGLTGFKGLWLGSWLESLGARVSGLALPPNPAMRAGWPGIETRFDCRAVDVRDCEAVVTEVRRTQPEVIFHLAAQPLVRLSYAEPVETFATNVQGTVHVLEAARRTPPVRAVVVVTSDKCYENREWVWGYREDEPMGGHDPYSASKGCAELVTAAYRRSFFHLPHAPQVASARAGNVIGGGDWAEDRLVPDLIRGVLADETVVIRRPTATRPWQHVLEPVAGYITLAERLLTDGTAVATGWNFGPLEAEPLTVREVARRLVSMAGSGRVEEKPDPAAAHEAHSLRLDSTKAVSELGWRPLLTTDERLRWTLDWYSGWHVNTRSAWERTHAQILAYQERMTGCQLGGESSSAGSLASSARPSRAA